jgi:group I intron endonuclease
MTATKVCTIYILINNVSGKVYIGQTWRTLKERFGSDGKSYKACNYLYSAIQKYGWNNFEHRKLTVELSQDGANAAEDFFINLYRSRDPNYGYNIRGGGSTGRLSEETKRKLSLLNSGENNSFFGKQHTPESKQKVSKNTKDAHKLGSYDSKNEDQKRFTNDEEKEILSIYAKGNITIKELLETFNFSRFVFNKMKKNMPLR